MQPGNTIVIIEGPDGAGKTKLAKSLEGEYFHEGPPPAGVSALDYYTRCLRRLDDIPRAVLDRFAMGELVYGPLLRGRSQITEWDYEHLIQVFAPMKHKVVTVMCLPPWNTCFANWKERSEKGGELFKEEELFRRSYEHFYALRHKADIIVDYTRGVSL